MTQKVLGGCFSGPVLAMGTRRTEASATPPPGTTLQSVHLSPDTLFVYYVLPMLGTALQVHAFDCLILGHPVK